MSGFEALYRSKIDEIISGDLDFENESDIEDAMIELHKAQSELDHFKNLKKRRVSYYDEAIEKSDRRASDIRRVIQQALEKFKKKSLKFPGIGSVSSTKRKGKWNIIDEDMLLSHLEELKLTDGIVEEVRKLNKKELNKVLDQLETNNNTGDSVKREDESTSIIVKFEEGVTPKSDDVPPTVSTKRVSKPVSTEIEI